MFPNRPDQPNNPNGRNVLHMLHAFCFILSVDWIMIMEAVQEEFVPISRPWNMEEGGQIANKLFDLANKLEKKKLYRFAEQVRGAGLT